MDDEGEFVPVRLSMLRLLRQLASGIDQKSYPVPEALLDLNTICKVINTICKGIDIICEESGREDLKPRTNQ